MVDFMNYKDEDDETTDCGYTQQDIDRCGAILDAYIDELAASEKDGEKIMGCVQRVIEALNTLNDDCDYSMIETGERENLCQFIEDAAVAAGLPQPDDDITEEWRDW